LVQQWVSFADAHLLPTITALSLPYLGMAEYIVKVEVKETQELERWFEYLEIHLKGRKEREGLWLVQVRREDGPSLADITVGGALVLGFKYWIDREFRDREFRDRYPRAVEWFGRLMEVERINEGFGDIVFLEKRKVLGCEKMKSAVVIND
jgi:glutathione S-transferase